MTTGVQEADEHLEEAESLQCVQQDVGDLLSVCCGQYTVLCWGRRKQIYFYKLKRLLLITLVPVMVNPDHRLFL